MLSSRGEVVKDYYLAWAIYHYEQANRCDKSLVALNDLLIRERNNKRRIARGAEWANHVMEILLINKINIYKAKRKEHNALFNHYADIVTAE